MFVWSWHISRQNMMHASSQTKYDVCITTSKILVNSHRQIMMCASSQTILWCVMCASSQANYDVHIIAGKLWCVHHRRQIMMCASLQANYELCITKEIKIFCTGNTDKQYWKLTVETKRIKLSLKLCLENLVS